MVLELFIEGHSVGKCLEEVLRQQPPLPRPSHNLLCGIDIRMSDGTRLYVRHDTGAQGYNWSEEVKVPFPNGTYEGERLAEGLIGLIRLEPSLMNDVSVGVGKDPKLNFIYAKKPGQEFWGVRTYIFEWEGGFSLPGTEKGTYRYINDNSGQGFDLAIALKVKGKEAGHQAIAALRDRLSHEAELRGIPVRNNGNCISFGQDLNKKMDETLIAEEVARGPKYIWLTSDDSANPAVNMSIEVGKGNFEFRTHERLNREDETPFGDLLRSPDRLRALRDDRLRGAIERATGAGLTAQLQQPWKVTYHFINPLFDPEAAYL